MSRYVDAEYIKAVMLNDRLMQGNAEYELWKQKVDAQVKAMPSIDIVRCGECKRNGTKDCAMWYDNAEYEIQYSWNNPNDFCSYGEREGE